MRPAAGITRREVIEVRSVFAPDLIPQNLQPFAMVDRPTQQLRQPLINPRDEVIGCFLEWVDFGRRGANSRGNERLRR